MLFKSLPCGPVTPSVFQPENVSGNRQKRARGVSRRRRAGTTLNEPKPIPLKSTRVWLSNGVTNSCRVPVSSSGRSVEVRGVRNAFSPKLVFATVRKRPVVAHPKQPLPPKTRRTPGAQHEDAAPPVLEHTLTPTRAMGVGWAHLMTTRGTRA